MMPLRAVSVLCSWQSMMVTSLSSAGVVAQMNVSPGVEAVLQFGALGILAIAVIKMFRELNEQRKLHSKTLDRLCDRWDAQQGEDRKTQHDDMQAVQSEVSKLASHCAAVQAVHRETRQ